MHHRLKGVLAAGACLIVMGSSAGCKTFGLDKIGIHLGGPPGQRKKWKKRKKHKKHKWKDD